MVLGIPHFKKPTYPGLVDGFVFFFINGKTSPARPVSMFFFFNVCEGYVKSLYPRLGLGGDLTNHILMISTIWFQSVMMSKSMQIFKKHHMRTMFCLLDYKVVPIMYKYTYVFIHIYIYIIIYIYIFLPILYLPIHHRISGYKPTYPSFLGPHETVENLGCFATTLARSLLYLMGHRSTIGRLP